MKLKHYKGNDWEVKVKYITNNSEVLGIKWVDRQGVIPIRQLPYSLVDEVIKTINLNDSGVCGSKMGGVYVTLTNYLDKLTKPKIINEREFKNDNFHIKVWETEDKIGAETVWIREGFKYNLDSYVRSLKVTIMDKGATVHNNKYPFFGLDWKTFETNKEDTSLNFTDLCKALERAEQETTELTYETVVKELEGLQGGIYLEKLANYEYTFGTINLGSENIDFTKAKWYNLRWFGSMHKEGHLAVVPKNINLDYLRQGCERGLIKLRRVK